MQFAIEQTHMRLGARSLALPAYFPSISSVKTSMTPRSYVALLSSLAGLNRQFLISAFDLANVDSETDMREQLSRARAADVVLLMDSGNYEAFWKGVGLEWRREDFHSQLARFTCDLCFTFDDQYPPADSADHLRALVKGWRHDQASAPDSIVVPIVHGNSDALPSLCASICEELSVSMVAVPERRLGDGVLSRAGTVRSIRHALRKLDRYVALHLLGTGNPISMAIYSAEGADTFDGLEWCQTVVDHSTAHLHHFSHADFLSGQSEWGLASVSYQARTLAHNLDFYSRWMRDLQKSRVTGSAIDFCRERFAVGAFEACRAALDWPAA